VLFGSILSVTRSDVLIPREWSRERCYARFMFRPCSLLRLIQRWRRHVASCAPALDVFLMLLGVTTAETSWWLACCSSWPLRLRQRQPPCI